MDLPASPDVDYYPAMRPADLVMLLTLGALRGPVRPAHAPWRRGIRRMALCRLADIVGRLAHGIFRAAVALAAGGGHRPRPIRAAHRAFLFCSAIHPNGSSIIAGTSLRTGVFWLPITWSLQSDFFL